VPGEQERQRREREVVATLVHVTHGVDPEDDEDATADRVRLRGEAHPCHRTGPPPRRVRRDRHVGDRAAGAPHGMIGA